MRLFQPSTGQSLAEINSTVTVPRASAGFWRNLGAYAGPGALVAVGYMDPGNWVTSIGGGQQFGYTLLSVILLSSLTAMLLQYMAAKLGIVTGLDLAQATARHVSRAAAVALWVLAELAIMATDIAEVVGAAIALRLLFGIPMLWGVLITVADVLLLLLLMKVGFRKVEAIVTTLILTILVVFAYEVAVARPDWGAVGLGFLPSNAVVAPGEFTMALGIVGATVMPHNLYLHSAIVQSRAYDRGDSEETRNAVRFVTWDSNLQLSVAFVVNSLLLLLGAALFYGKSADLSSLGSLYDALENPAVAGAVASPVLSVLFAVALLASGQNSTITGTLSGQVVMEGFLNLRMPLWARRLVTRLIAVVPVLAFTVAYGGSEARLEGLLVGSQVFLCMALPFTIVPLVYFTSSKRYMGSYANRPIVAVLGWVAATVLSVLNISLLMQIITG